MSIYNEVFDRCYNELAGTAGRVKDVYNKRRYNRAILALRCQNYFLSCEFTNESGLAGVTGTDRTDAIERRIILRGGGMDACFIGGTGLYFDVPPTGEVNVRVFRSGSNKPQFNLEKLRPGHYFSEGGAQPFALQWPIPMTLEPNEIILTEFEQVSACAAETIYALNFYGVAVDPYLRCESALPESISEQIARIPIQRPRYLHLKTDNGAGTICFDSVISDARAVGSTIEAPDHMLVLGWRRWVLGMNQDLGASPRTNVRLVINGGSAFSRVEIPVKGFEYFARAGDGYFKFAVPHFVPKGSSLALSVTSDITDSTPPAQYEGEVELLCVTV